MKKTGIALYSFVFFGLSFFAFNMVFTSMTNEGVFDVSKNLILHEFKTPSVAFQTGKCSEEPMIARIDASTEPHLQKLAEYQRVCGSLVTTTLMVFTGIPKDATSAEASAEKMAGMLAEFSAFRIQPIVMVDPGIGQDSIDFSAFKKGLYDPFLQIYFSTLKEKGIRDSVMGTWVPFPEANLPNWNHSNVAPSDFSILVNRYLGALKKEFPEAKGSILLNSSTYEHDGFDWTEGEYVSLVPYVSGIKNGLIDSFGIQGFPWMPPAESGRFGVLDAREYLNAHLAMEAADALGVKNIWFNTGTFSRKYTLDEDKTITVDPGRRKDILNGIISEVDSARKKGYSVSINLVSRDESGLAEATDWSYWRDPNDALNLHVAVFIDFVVKMKEMGIPFSIFDVAR